MIESETDIMMITETKGQPPYTEGYTWYSKNRLHRKGGGIAIGIRNELAKFVKEEKNIEDQDQEVIWLELNIPGNEKHYMGCFYGPQENSPVEEIERQYSQLETQIHKYKKKGNIILTGDFNAKIRTPEQEESRNGIKLKHLLESTEMKIMNHKSKTGVWTRVNRNNPSERSIIDYLIVNENMEERIKEVEIDEEGTLRMRGHNSESDHNTITATVQLRRQNVKKTYKKWKLNNREGWLQYNKKLEGVKKEDLPETYEECKKLIEEILKETVGQTKITIRERKRRESEEVKNLRKLKKDKRKEFEKAQQEDKQRKLQEYYTAQHKLREQIRKEEQGRIRQLVEEIRGSKHPRNKIWEMRKKLLKTTKEEYDIIKEDGETVTDANDTKEYIARYYEELYKAREGRPGTEQWTEKIKNEVKEMTAKAEKQENEPEITETEMRKVQKMLKRRKANGLDDIPNEIFTNASNGTLRTYKNIINKTIHNKEIPKEWKHGEIISIYKGKGVKGKCSNERGITLSSNFGKVYERLICERMKKEIKISDAQGGGRKGSSTSDYIRILGEVLRNNQRMYVAFLDVTKAYDKAWADALMYVMKKKGLKDKLWLIVKKLNEDLTATIRTKHGHTRNIKIKDSIRQGGVLSVTLYASLMDEIAEEISKLKLGVKISENHKVGCLLWMDDVVLIAKEREELQKMLDITDEIASRYHIEFGTEKSKVMKTGNKKEAMKFKLGEKHLDECEKYKYLGVIFNKGRNMKHHIEEIKKKTEAAYQVIMRIVGSADFCGIEMETIWQLVECCIIPTITYGIEVCKLNKTEIKALNSILDTILKRILKLPITTPREPIYWETGIMDIEHTIRKNAINFSNRYKKTANKILRELMKEDLWMAEICKEKVELGLENEKSKNVIKKTVSEMMMYKMKKEGEKKSKAEFYMKNTREQDLGKRRKYMEQATRHTANNIITARTRMIEVKSNYKGKYNNLNCRFCGGNQETQKHILEECQQINRNEYNIITEKEIFSEDLTENIQTAEKIHKIRKLLTDISVAPI
jgi:hypothetical protein